MYTCHVIDVIALAIIGACFAWNATSPSNICKGNLKGIMISMQRSKRCQWHIIVVERVFSFQNMGTAHVCWFGSREIDLHLQVYTMGRGCIGFRCGQLLQTYSTSLVEDMSILYEGVCAFTTVFDVYEPESNDQLCSSMQRGGVDMPYDVGICLHNVCTGLSKMSIACTHRYHEGEPYRDYTKYLRYWPRTCAACVKVFSRSACNAN